MAAFLHLGFQRLRFSVGQAALTIRGISDTHTHTHLPHALNEPKTHCRMEPRAPRAWGAAGSSSLPRRAARSARSETRAPPENWTPHASAARRKARLRDAARAPAAEQARRRATGRAASRELPAAARQTPSP
eukprot:5687025-Prymnesium_polylepis.2